jgi:sugar-specific transcriptional regulator TrmB
MAVTTPKKRGRPRKTPLEKLDTLFTADTVRQHWERRYSELQEHHESILSAMETVEKSLTAKCNYLEHQAIGYRAVISYLENTIERLIANPVRGN